MPSYNSEKNISNSIESVINQSYVNWELLITDDCSTDNTISIIKKYAEIDSRIKLFTNTINSGAAISRNNSLEHAQGDFIAFLDSDDIWFSDKLSTQIAFMTSESKIAFSFTAYEIINDDGFKTNKTVDLQGEKLSFSYYDMLRKKATLGCSTVMLRKKSFNDHKMPLIRTGQDYALWLKLLKSGQPAYLINNVLTQYRISPNSISRNKLKKCKRQWQIYRNIEKINFFHSFFYFSHYAWRAVFRR